MVLDAIRRELLSMESVIAIGAIAFALPAVYFGGQWAAMESGFAILWATAIYPLLYYHESGGAITSAPRAASYGVGIAGAVYLAFLFWYAIAGRLSVEGFTAEVVAFVLVSVTVFGLARLEKRRTNGSGAGVGSGTS